MPDIQTVKRRALVSKLVNLSKDYEDTVNQSALALGPVERNRLNRQAQEIYAEMEKTDQELTNLELVRPEGSVGTSTPDPAHVQRELHSKLPEIDFDKVEEAICMILKKYKEDGCAALLLFQQSTKMGGEWCAARVRDLLSRETGSGLFRHIPLEFQLSEFADKMAPLRRLGQELGLESKGQHADGFSKSVVDKLCGMLQSGNIFLVEYRRWDYLKDTPDIIQWFLENFWRPLIRELQQAVRAKKYSRVTIIVLLFADAALPDHFLAREYFCTGEEFYKEKLLELTLERWTKNDIENWIVHFSGLNLPEPQVDLMAERIFQATEGLPTLVVHELLSQCSSR